MNHLDCCNNISLSGFVVGRPKQEKITPKNGEKREKSSLQVRVFKSPNNFFIARIEALDGSAMDTYQLNSGDKILVSGQLDKCDKGVFVRARKIYKEYITEDGVYDKPY